MKGKQQQKLPRARKEGLVVQEMPEEVLVYDLQRHKAHCLNESASLIWKHCDGKTSVTEMARILERDLKSPVDESMVWLGLSQLEKFHLLGDGAALPAESKLSRRQVMKRLGVGAALAVPVIMSISAPLAAQVATCTPRNGNCATIPCCPGCNCNPQSVCVGTCP